MNDDIRKKLAIEKNRVDEINDFLINPDNKLINNFLSIVEKYGTPDEINKKSQNARKLENLMKNCQNSLISLQLISYHIHQDALEHFLPKYV